MPALSSLSRSASDGRVNPPLKLDAAAAVVGCHRATLLRAVDAGDLVPLARRTSALNEPRLFDRSELARWAEVRRGSLAPMPEAVLAAVSRIVAEAPPLPDDAIEVVVRELGDGLRRARAELVGA